MTKREWKVGERCWVDDEGIRPGEVVGVVGPYIDVRTNVGSWDHSAKRVYATRDAARLQAARDAVEGRRQDERVTRDDVRSARVDLRRAEAELVRRVASREKAEKRLAALRAKVAK